MVETELLHGIVTILSPSQNSHFLKNSTILALKFERFRSTYKIKIAIKFEKINLMGQKLGKRNLSIRSIDSQSFSTYGNTILILEHFYLGPIFSTAL